MTSQIAPSQTPSDTEARANRGDDALALEEDARLRTDIRLLGRILGDTVRDPYWEQAGRKI
jgi:phosphoenolpyruvate carboxylase